MPDVIICAIICAKIEVKKLRGLGFTGGQILGSSIEMAGHPYNSAALPRSLWIGVMGSVVSYPSGDWGAAPAETVFGVPWPWKMTSGCSNVKDFPYSQNLKHYSRHRFNRKRLRVNMQNWYVCWRQAAIDSMNRVKTQRNETQLTHNSATPQTHKCVFNQLYKLKVKGRI